MSATYRIRQFLRAAGAWFRPEDSDCVRRYLPGAAADLFWGMPRYDRQHAYKVLHTLQGEGHSDPDLLAAALLHDVGKTAQPSAASRLAHRVAVVVLQAIQPHLLEQIGQDRPGSWRRPFYTQRYHAIISADLARGANCSARTVELIRHHEDPSAAVDDPDLAALQAADSAN
jgi:hypothetical protein